MQQHETNVTTPTTAISKIFTSSLALIESIFHGMRIIQIVDFIKKSPKTQKSINHTRVVRERTFSDPGTVLMFIVFGSDPEGKFYSP